MDPHALPIWANQPHDLWYDARYTVCLIHHTLLPFHFSSGSFSSSSLACCNAPRAGNSSSTALTGFGTKARKSESRENRS